MHEHDVERTDAPLTDTAYEDTTTDRPGHATTGGSMLAGAITGGVVGTAAGPIGTVVGAVAGAMVGAATERAMHGQPGHEHREGDEHHWVGDHEHTGHDDGHDHTHHHDLKETGNQRTMELREEELAVHKERVETGQVHVGKEVVTEHRTMEVPVTRQEVFLEREPVARRAADASIDEWGETLRVPVTEERVSVEKKPVVYEEVRVGTRPVQETEHVSETVRREEARVEERGDAPYRDNRGTERL